MTVAEYVDLVRELVRSRLDASVPELTPEIDAAADALEYVADAAQERLEQIGLGYDADAEAIEVNFEKNADEVAALLERSLGFWTNWLALSESPRGRKRLEEKYPDRNIDDERDRALRGRALYLGVFGEDGLEYVSMGYFGRFTMLSALLRSLTSGTVGGVDVNELLQPPYNELLPLIRAKYEADLEEHLSLREDAHELAAHRVALRMALAEYTHLLREAPDRWSQDSCDRVNRALIPLEDRCRLLNRRH